MITVKQCKAVHCQIGVSTCTNMSASDMNKHIMCKLINNEVSPLSLTAYSIGTSFPEATPSVRLNFSRSVGLKLAHVVELVNLTAFVKLFSAWARKNRRAPSYSTSS